MYSLFSIPFVTAQCFQYWCIPWNQSYIFGQYNFCTNVITGVSVTHKFVRFGACFRQMTHKMNLHCDTLDAHNACQNELIHSHILLSLVTFIFVSSSNCCKKLLSIYLLQLDEISIHLLLSYYCYPVNPDEKCTAIRWLGTSNSA